MRSALIVSNGEVLTEMFVKMLAKSVEEEPVIVKTCGDARRTLIDRSFDICVVNAPLPDETGFRFSVDVIGEKSNQVILVVKQEIFAEVTDRVEEYGVFTVPKPLSKATFWAAVKMAGAAYNRLNRARTENDRLKRKLDELKLVSRAKILLVEREGLTEEEAHKKIEQEAMDSRRTKTEIARSIINIYEN